MKIEIKKKENIKLVPVMWEKMRVESKRLSRDLSIIAMASG